MTPVTSWRQGAARPEPYLPGSSLKGTLRSHAERIARTLCFNPDQWKLGACDPFNSHWEKPDGSCGERFQFRKDGFDELKRRGRDTHPDDEIPPSVAYRDSCPACKIFGNTFLLGRFSIGDAYLTPEGRRQHKVERRDMVGIDRFTGGSSGGAKFDLDVVVNAVFHTQVKVVNFELWHLGLVAFVLRDLTEGLIPLGMGKSRGLGQVSAQVLSTELHFANSCLTPEQRDRIWGLYGLESQQARDDYGYWAGENEGLALADHDSPEDFLGLRTIHRLEGEQTMSLWRQAASRAARRLEEYQIPPKMRHDYLVGLQRQ